MSKQATRSATVNMPGLPGVVGYTIKEMSVDVLHLTNKGNTIVLGAGTTTGKDGKEEHWATVYRIEAEETYLNGKPLRAFLMMLKKYYKKMGWDFAVSYAATPWQKFHLDMANIPVREECSGVLVDRMGKAECELA